MRIVFYSVILNNHQVHVADALWELTEHDYCFVELANLQAENRKGDTHDYMKRPYLLRAWKSTDEYNKAMYLACSATCCVFSGVQALPFQRERMKLGLLSFDMSERWLKRGIANLFTPTIFKMFLAYYFGKWKHKPLYKLCCSAFAAPDHKKLGMFQGKCYKWGYFTHVEKKEMQTAVNISSSNVVSFMWCSRYLKWKHPELPVFMAHRLKCQGFRFKLDMYGSGQYENDTQKLAKELGVDDIVHFIGIKSNDELLSDMCKHEIFLFTSDKNEGWGAVANESMANGCVLVASDAIGSSPYLVKNGQTGLLFNSPKTTSCIQKPDKEAIDSLCEKVAYLLKHPQERYCIRQRSLSLMQSMWNPQEAAKRLMVLIDQLQTGKDTIYNEGPCSKA